LRGVLLGRLRRPLTSAEAEVVWRVAESDPPFLCPAVDESKNPR